MKKCIMILGCMLQTTIILPMITPGAVTTPKNTAKASSNIINIPFGYDVQIQNKSSQPATLSSMTIQYSRSDQPTVTTYPQLTASLSSQNVIQPGKTLVFTPNFAITSSTNFNAEFQGIIQITVSGQALVFKDRDNNPTPNMATSPININQVNGQWIIEPEAQASQPKTPKIPQPKTIPAPAQAKSSTKQATAVAIAKVQHKKGAKSSSKAQKSKSSSAATKALSAKTTSTTPKTSAPTTAVATTVPAVVGKSTAAAPAVALTTNAKTASSSSVPPMPQAPA